MMASLGLERIITMDRSPYDPFQENQTDTKKSNPPDKGQEDNLFNTEKQDDYSDVTQVFESPNAQGKASEPGSIEKIGKKLDVALTSKGQGLKNYLDDLKLAYEMLKDPTFHVGKNTKITLVIALLYLISPIDLIPDSIPVIGLLDDALVVGFALKQTATELERYRQHRSMNQSTLQTEI